MEQTSRSAVWRYTLETRRNSTVRWQDPQSTSVEQLSYDDANKIAWDIMQMNFDLGWEKYRLTRSDAGRVERLMLAWVKAESAPRWGGVRYDAFSRVRQGVCGRPLDEHGYCDQAGDHTS